MIDVLNTGFMKGTEPMTEDVREKNHTHISSKQKLLDLNLKEVWRYRDLIILFTKRTFQVTYKQTILGPAWLFLNPFITSVIHTLVFGGIAGIATDGVPKILFYMGSHAIWSFFSSCFSSNAHTFTNNAHMFGKVYFPRLTKPISNMLNSVIRFGIQMLMFGFFFVYFLWKGEVSPHWLAWLLIPGVLLHLGIMGVGCGIIVSSLTTKYRDLSILVGFGVQLWMYATPVVYPLSQLGDSAMKTALLINPVTMPVEIFRYAVLGHGTIIPEYLALSWAFTVLVAFFGVVLFNRVEKTFMDTV